MFAGGYWNRFGRAGYGQVCEANVGRGCARLDLEHMMARICVWGGGKGFWEGEGVSREGLGVGQGWWKYRGFGEKSGSDCWEGGRVGAVGGSGRFLDLPRFVSVSLWKGVFQCGFLTLLVSWGWRDWEWGGWAVRDFGDLGGGFVGVGYCDLAGLWALCC